MKKFFTLAAMILLFLASDPLFAQVGIGTTTPDGSSMLDIVSPGNNKGILPPRMTDTQMQAIPFPATGLMVYNTTFNACFYYNGTIWVTLLGSANGWALNGNTLTGTEFLGSLNLQPVVFKTNNSERMRISQDGNVGIGTDSPAAPLHVIKPSHLSNEYEILRLERLWSGGTHAAKSELAFYDGNYAEQQVKYAQIMFDVTDITAGKESADLRFWTRNNGVLANTLTLTGAGFAGIGTTAPSNALHINAKDPLRLEGLQTSSEGDVLVVDKDGVITKRNGGIGADWSLTGNAGTTAGTNFLGTTDMNELVFKMNNQNSGLIGFNGRTFLGYHAGNVNTGYFNTGIGLDALIANTTAGSNVAVGAAALSTQSFSNGDVLWESNNTAVGYQALLSNQPTSTSNGSFNTAIGAKSLYYNTIGANNTGVGFNSLNANTTGNFNAALGAGALMWNTTGLDNTGVGAGALGQNTTGNYNSAVGDGAMLSNSIASSNVAFGVQSMYLNTTASKNVAVGVNTLHQQSFSNGGVVWNSCNTALGEEALYHNQPVSTGTGAHNTATGYVSLYYNTTGLRNTASGSGAMFYNSTGSVNTAFGNNALLSNSAGSGNVALGSEAGYWETEDNHLWIDNAARESLEDAQQKALIYGTFDDDPANQLLTFNAFVGIGTIAPVSKLEITGTYNGHVNLLTPLTGPDNYDMISLMTKDNGGFNGDAEIWMNPEEGIHMVKGTGELQISNNELEFFSAGGNMTLNNGFFGVNSTGSPQARCDVNGDIATRQNTYAAVDGNNDDIIVGTFSFIRISGPSAAFSVTGIAGGVDGKIVTLYNSTSQDMTIADEDSGSTAANRITTLTGADITTAGTGTITLQYSSADSRWIVIGYNL